MADIFISYSKDDPEHTVALAPDLGARGYSVWWDTSLLPGDEFLDIIKRQIDDAKVVIVIWTKHSVVSKWVRSEAVHADHDNKLITLAAPGLSFRDIPLPFNTRHCEPVSDRAKLYASLAGRGVFPPSISSGSSSKSADDLYMRANNYFFGLAGFPQNDREAASLYTCAALLGHPSAICTLGFLHANGNGVPPR